MRLVDFRSFLQPQVNEFLAKALPESGREYDPEGKHKPLTDIAENFRMFWVLVDDDQEIIGTIAINDLKFDERYADVLHRNSGEIKCYYLLKAYWGEGLGKKMMGFAIDQARSFGYTWLYLDTISSKSESAISIYEQFGFEKIDRYDDNRDADFFMRLKL
ncbi:MAG: GNAT family N-acetyltransferase [Clostridiales bacterium]|nr:GNAT family N-acetyltransferase [Clostridiales bacterium]